MKKTNIYILCGGKGKRMKKYTKKIPKPLVKVGKMPIIEHKIKYYRYLDFGLIFLNFPFRPSYHNLKIFAPTCGFLFKTFETPSKRH